MKNRLHVQPNWSPVVGENVEIRLRDKAMRTGRVDGVTPDDQNADNEPYIKLK